MMSQEDRIFYLRNALYKEQAFEMRKNKECKTEK